MKVPERAQSFVSKDKKGRDLQPYYVGRYQTPATMGYRLPDLPSPVQGRSTTPERPTTPGADDPLLPEERTVAEQEEIRTRGTSELVPIVDPPVTASTTLETAAGINLPQLPRRPQAELLQISRKEQGKSHHLRLNQSLMFSFKVFPTNWMMKNGLIRKRIWAYVRKSIPDPFEPEGFMRGRYEGERVLILSGEHEGEIVVNVRQQSVKIPGKYLFPQIPTTKGQDVVVMSGDKAGEVYLTRRQNEDGTFSLGRRGYKGTSPLCTLEANKLARCDPV